MYYGLRKKTVVVDGHGFWFLVVKNHRSSVEPGEQAHYE